MQINSAMIPTAQLAFSLGIGSGVVKGRGHIRGSHAQRINGETTDHPRITYTNHQRIDITLFIKDTIVIFHQ